MVGLLGYGRYSPGRPAADEDVLTMMIAAATQVLGTGARPNRLALASTALPYSRRVQAGLLTETLSLPAGTFCLECTTSARAGTEAMIGLGTGLVLAADGGHAAALLLGAGAGVPAPVAFISAPIAFIEATQSAVAEYPGLEFTAAGQTGVADVTVADYTEAAYLDLLQKAAQGLKADVLALNPPAARLAKLGAKALGFKEALTAPEGSGSAGPLLALFAALEKLSSGQRVLLVSYGSGSAADAVLVKKA